MRTPRLPSYFLCHGGGPWPWMQGPLRQLLSGLEQGLKAVPAQLSVRPAAILVVSAHWEEPHFTVTSAAAPGMVYDYHGFPPETYAIRYPCPGAPELAERVVDLLRAAGFSARSSATRGYDHGTYSVLQPMFPHADIPVLQLSLQTSLDPKEHWRAGVALRGLREDQVLIIGSGMSCHERGPEMAQASPAFDQWLHQALLPENAPREQALAAWTQAPYARAVHPRAEHLLPLMVAARAAAGEPATCIYSERLMGHVAISSFRFGDSTRPTV